MEKEEQKLIRITPPNRYQNMSAAGFFLSLVSVLIIVGIALNEQMGTNWVANTSLALLVGVAGLAMLTTQGGVVVDTSRRRAKHYSKTLGLSSGKWQDLDGLKHISVVRYKQEAAFNFLSISYHQQNKPVHVRLILGGRRYIQLVRGDYAKAWPIVEQLSEALHVPIFRYVGQEKEWLAPGGRGQLDEKGDAQE